MITTESKPRIAPQNCPLCSEPQEVIINGTISLGDGNAQLDENRGYSFCNCRNIFFTNWENIQQGVYDPSYAQKYANENVDKYLKRYGKAYIPKIKEHISFGKVLEIGCINPSLLDEFKKEGYETYGLDIFQHDLPGNGFIKANFEEFNPVYGDFSVVWASHVFEHFKDPANAIWNARELLVKDGILFVAMPDPYFIDYRNPYQSFPHFHLEEHHILWDMDSFCEAAEESGFETILKHRNVGYDHICTTDYHLMFKKK